MVAPIIAQAGPPAKGGTGCPKKTGHPLEAVLLPGLLAALFLAGAKAALLSALLPLALLLGELAAAGLVVLLLVHGCISFLRGLPLGCPPGGALFP